MIAVYPVLRQRMRERQITNRELSVVAGMSNAAFFLSMLGIRRWKLTEAVNICCFFRTYDIEQLFVRKHFKSQLLESQEKFGRK